jgi:hypothetical protein
LAGRKLHLSSKNRFYADGGYIVHRPEFTLACANVSFDRGKTKHGSEERFKRLKRLYGNDIFILPSPDLGWNLNLSPHIDLVVLPIPEAGVIFVDKQYYNQNAHESIDNLCTRFGLKLEIVDNDYARPSYPCNSLVVTKGTDPLVITNSTGNEGFLRKLDDYCIEYLAVPFSNNCANGGSIHCATNALPERRLKEIADIFTPADL